MSRQTRARVTKAYASLLGHPANEIVSAADPKVATLTYHLADLDYFQLTQLAAIICLMIDDNDLHYDCFLKLRERRLAWQLKRT